MIKKIMIFGRPGSGKSTFALDLQKMLKIPFYHLDKYFFRDNWVERDYDEFLEKQNLL
jgi:adenylate kinase family enzyme